MRAILAWLLAWTALLGGCSGEQEPPLRVGTYPWPGFATLHHARALGRLDPARVRLVDYDAAGQVMQALRQGSIDAAGLTLNEALLVAKDLRGARVVLVFGESAGGDALVARPPLVHLKQLRGRRLGVEREAEGEYLLARILDRAGLKEEDVEAVDLSLEEHEQAFRSGRVDALITMDPVRARLMRAGANELFSSREIAGELVDVLLVAARTPDTHPRALRALANAHFQAMESIRNDPEEAAARLPQRFGQAEQLLWSWRMLNFAGRGANVRLLEFGTLGQSAARVGEVMRRHGMLSNGEFPRLELDPRFVTEGGG
jgi:NitT/TauT family transport system substrate-binding protein